MNKPLNKRQGGSYTKDPKTGELTLVAQTKLAQATASKAKAKKGS